MGERAATTTMATSGRAPMERRHSMGERAATITIHRELAKKVNHHG